MDQIQTLVQKISTNIESVIMGKPEQIRKTLLALLCGGHILLEDMPGTGKTTLAKALARSIDCTFKRVQFTPDLLPSDLTGINFYSQKIDEFVFNPGALFTNILLADEINRATPRTQSSLLECMEERQITIDGQTHKLDSPFLVIATQNPIEIQGTYPLPEAQLDRFFVRLSVGYPDKDAEREMLSVHRVHHTLDELKAVVAPQEIIEAQNAVREIKVSMAVSDYIVAIVSATRSDEKVRLGVSPRGTLALMRAAQANAAMEGRSYVQPDDVKAVCYDVLCHRMIVRGFGVVNANEMAVEILKQILVKIPVPIE